MTVIGAKEDDDNKAFIYIKECEKREWLDILERRFDHWDADYEDINSLNNLDITNAMQCVKYVNYALQNVRYIIGSCNQKGIHQV